MAPQEEAGFRGISIKKELIDAIEKFIESHPDRGYKSVAEFVAEAIRLRIDELKKLLVQTL